MANLDLSTDYRVFNEGDIRSLSNSTVSLISRNWTYNAVTKSYSFVDTTVSCPNTLRLNSIVEEKEKSGGVYMERQARFYLATQAFTSPYTTQPKLGDHIVQSNFLQIDEIGRTWTIIKVRKPVFDDCWTCDCIIADINGTLDDTVSIYRQTESTNLDGDRTTTTYPVQPNLSARIQPDAQEVIDNLGKRILLRKYIIYVKGLSNYTFVYGDLAVDRLGTKYKITKVSNDRSITDLITLNVEKIDVG
jgi:hypothetical protein